MNKPRELTSDEVREKFLNHVRGVVAYWNEVHPLHLREGDDPVRYRLEGVAFSILAAIDGSSMALPAFSLVPNPHPDDREFQQSNGSDWFPDHGDIAGGLHESIAMETRR